MILYYVSDDSLTPDGVAVFYSDESEARAQLLAEGAGTLCTLHVSRPLTYTVTDPVSV